MGRLVVTSVLVALAMCANAEPKHVVDGGTTTFGPTTSVAFDKDIEASARKFQAQYPQGADRYAQFDISYPRDRAEYQAMGKYAIVLLAALTHDPAELPLSRVYVRDDGHETELKRIVAVRRQVPDRSATLAMYGMHREDAFYMLPVSLVHPGAEIVCDFAAHRRGFSLGTLELPPVDFIRSDDNRSAGHEPSDVALRAFFHREYPGILP